MSVRIETTAEGQARSDAQFSLRVEMRCRLRRTGRNFVGVAAEVEEAWLLEGRSEKSSSELKPLPL